MPGPLTGYRVIDLSSTLSGPYSTQVLADFGADVIKVETSVGDITRNFAPSRAGGDGSVFLNINRGKRSVVLNLKDEADRGTLLALAEDADVLVHNIRPDAMKRLRLNYEVFAELTPRLVYCAITGYGSGGRYSGQPAYDDIVQAATGMAWLQGLPRAANPEYIATAIADKTAGLFAAAGILAALVQRGPQGPGQYLEVPMFETLAAFALAEQIGGRAYLPPIGPTGYQRMRSPWRRPYATKDSFVSVMVYTTRHWQEFLTYVGKAELLSDERFDTVTSRSRNIDELYELISIEMVKKTSAEWIAELAALDVPVGPVRSLDDLFEDEHLKEVDFFVEYEHPVEGTIVGVRSPVLFGSTPLASPGEVRPPPTLGQHTDEIRAEFGQSADPRKEAC